MDSKPVLQIVETNTDGIPTGRSFMVPIGFRNPCYASQKLINTVVDPDPVAPEGSTIGIFEYYFEWGDASLAIVGHESK